MGDDDRLEAHRRLGGRTTIDEMRELSDWQHAMVEACGPDLPGPDWSALATVIHSSEGENDGASWIAIFKMIDGRFLYIEAGCDNTGWDCYASGAHEIADRYEDLIRYQIGDEARERFGIVLSPLEPSVIGKGGPFR